MLNYKIIDFFFNIDVTWKILKIKNLAQYERKFERYPHQATVDINNFLSYSE